MSINDTQFNQCCDYLDELFAGLILSRCRENNQYIFTVSRALMGERLFSSFKPLFQNSSYLNDTTSIQFNFDILAANSPLLTKEGLRQAYYEMPRKFARYIAGEQPEISVYEREHFNQALGDALLHLPGKRVEDLRWLIQQTLSQYQTSFDQASSYKEKNAALLKMNQLYNSTRNANQLVHLVQTQERAPSLAEEKLFSAEKQRFSHIPYREEPRVESEFPAERKEIIINYPRSKTGGLSLSSLFGLFIGFAMLSWIIYTDSDAYRLFLSLDSLIFVLGATMACSMISYHGLYIVLALKEIIQIFIPTHVNPASLLRDVETLLKWSQKFKENRPFNELEALFADYKDPDAAFMQTAVYYVLENYKSEKLKQMLTNLINTMFERSQVQVNVIRTMGNIASVFGILGALISFIVALSHTYNETNQLLHAIAASLVPMVYGFVFAFLLFKPAARKLEQKNQMRRFRNQLLSCGFVMLSENCSALEIQDTLNSFLEPTRHFHVVKRQ